MHDLCQSESHFDEGTSCYLRVMLLGEGYEQAVSPCDRRPVDDYPELAVVLSRKKLFLLEVDGGYYFFLRYFIEGKSGVIEEKAYGLLLVSLKDPLAGSLAAHAKVLEDCVWSFFLHPQLFFLSKIHPFYAEGQIGLEPSFFEILEVDNTDHIPQ